MRPSIRRRLVVLTAVATAVVVGLVALFIWWRMGSVLRDEFDQKLLTEARSLAARLEMEHGRLHFEVVENDSDVSGLHGDVMVLVVTLSGQPLFSSTDSQEYGLFVTMRKRLRRDDIVSWRNIESSSNRCFRAVALRARAAPDDESVREPSPAELDEAWVFLARPLDPVQRTMTHLAWALAGAMVLALTATAAAAHHVAKRGVRPIRTVAEIIGNAEPGQSELAVDRRTVPEELDPIVGKTGELLRKVEAELGHQRQLTADVAHDLRTPVAGVRTLLDVCLQKERSSAEYRETVATARAAMRHLSTLLDDVLLIARLDADTELPVTAPVRVADAVADAVDMVRPIGVSRSVHIDTSGELNAVVLNDRVKLTKIIANLAANAVEHGPSDSTVGIDVSISDPSIEIRVRDQGPGIDADLKEAVFNRFVRGDLTRAGDGHHGLGLAIVRGLARLLGGDVTIESSSSKGTVFLLTLPNKRTVH